MILPIPYPVIYFSAYDSLHVLEPKILSLFPFRVVGLEIEMQEKMRNMENLQFRNGLHYCSCKATQDL